MKNRTNSLYDAKAKLSQIIREVREHGASATLTYHGEPVAVVVAEDAALARFVAPAFAVGVRLEPDDAISVAAPFGLEDVFSLTIRPNPDRPLARGWDKAVANATARWPELTIVEPEIK